MTHAWELPSVILSCLPPTVHDQEPSQAPGLCGGTEWGRCHQAAPVLQGDRLGAAGAEENQAPLQAENCKWVSALPLHGQLALSYQSMWAKHSLGCGRKPREESPLGEAEALDVDCQQ